jgi:sulfoxide reductase heme-binding subunit YedZ
VRVSGSVLISIGAVAALVALGVTDQVLPAVDPRTAELRPWIAARALGITAYMLLTLEVGLGLVLSHPRNTGEWRKTKPTLPWHEMVSVFTFAFVTLHVVLLAIDPYAKVGIIGALVPGFSEFRPVAVALGSIALYAMLITAITAKWTRLLPSGWWLRIHRVAAVAFLLTWIHAVLAGTDSGALLPLYLATGLAILAGVAHRWWTARVRPQHATSGLVAAVQSPSPSYSRPAPAPTAVEES